tara:strand:- start:206 stop:991 length:786 start_codon:yes stop_codon:yes gene_type:complete
MAIITLTTDLGIQDHYVAVLKGTILTQCSDAIIIDITHEIPPFNILRASFILKNAFESFPKGSIHLIGVDAESDAKNKQLAILYKEHYFIGPDNGIFSLVFEEQPSKIFSIDFPISDDEYSFPAKGISAKAACHLAKGGTLEMVGKEQKEIMEKGLFRAVSVGNVIKGMAIHIDNYGNIITNIDQVFFKQFGQQRDFNIEFRHGDYTISEISKSYLDVPEGEKLALFSSSNLLEISINKGNAGKLLGIKENDLIRIEFYDR